MSPVNKMLMGELEDTIRRRTRRRKANGPERNWAKDRQMFLELAAWCMRIVEQGDEDAAAQEKDPGTTG